MNSFTPANTGMLRHRENTGNFTKTKIYFYTGNLSPTKENFKGFKIKGKGVVAGCCYILAFGRICYVYIKTRKPFCQKPTACTPYPMMQWESGFSTSLPIPSWVEGSSSSCRAIPHDAVGQDTIPSPVMIDTTVNITFLQPSDVGGNNIKKKPKRTGKYREFDLYQNVATVKDSCRAGY